MEHIDEGNPANRRDYGNKECPVCLGTKRNPYEDTFVMCDNCCGDGVVPKTREDYENERDDWKSFFREDK